MIQFHDLADPLASEVKGIDLGQSLDDDTFNKINSMFNERSVLLFRNQHITEKQHIAFSRRFGNLEIHVLQQYLLSGHPEILLISNIEQDGKPIGISDAGQYWHTDLSYVEVPSRCSILYGKTIPNPENDHTYGDTCFVSTVAAYEALSPEMKQRLSTLKARHSYSARYQSMKNATGSKRGGLTEEQKKKVADVVHPVIRTHPATGKKSIYINEGFTTEIVGLAHAESEALLSQLNKHCQSEQFMYRHKWQAGDILMWDNCSTQHLAIADYGAHQPRLMHRTTITGTAVI